MDYEVREKPERKAGCGRIARTGVRTGAGGVLAQAGYRRTEAIDRASDIVRDEFSYGIHSRSGWIPIRDAFSYGMPFPLPYQSTAMLMRNGC
jgi:hypothetical protein